ncbi:MAG: twin-arginine translocase TatA/TatE family subunit [Verrucomicrobiales bacterium]|nr:twin-arginine translocase TatA/TatE family subunit [Verrucomicrobiales bacterium]
MFGLGGSELMVVMAIVLILFGAKKIPEFAKGLGSGIKEFRKASREVQEEIERAGREVDEPPPSRPAPTPIPAANQVPTGSGEGSSASEPGAEPATPPKA